MFLMEQKKEAYNEDDKTNPQSVYGKSKKAGEDNVISTLDKYFIVRTAWLYGIGRNFVNKMLELSEKNNSINVVCDQVGSPTSATEVAKVIELLLSSNKYGIYMQLVKDIVHGQILQKKFLNYVKMQQK